MDSASRTRRTSTARSNACVRSRGMYVAVQPVVALVAGVLILAMPRLLNYIVAIYLIVIGILGLARF